MAMTWADHIKRWFTGAAVPDADRTIGILKAAGVAVDAEVSDVPEPPDPATFAADRQAAEAARAALAQERGKRIATEAAAFSQEQIPARLVPASKQALTALFAQLAEDDARESATVTFAEGKTGGRIDALKALIGSLPELHLTEEKLAHLQGIDEEKLAQFVKANRTRQEGDGKMSEERRKELMRMSELGRAVLRS
jgi:hypothetical protein